MSSNQANAGVYMVTGKLLETYEQDRLPLGSVMITWESAVLCAMEFWKKLNDPEGFYCEEEDRRETGEPRVEIVGLRLNDKNARCHQTYPVFIMRLNAKGNLTIESEYDYKDIIKK